MKILFMFVFFGGQDHVIGSRLRSYIENGSLYRSQNFLGTILPSNH
jgi:hypothetical protein